MILFPGKEVFHCNKASAYKLAIEYNSIAKINQQQIRFLIKKVLIINLSVNVFASK